MALALWFVALLGLLVGAAVASGRGRASPLDVVSRAVFVIAALAYAAIVASTVWTWGGATAADARTARLRDGATVHLAISGVRVGLDHTITIGHGADATVRVPGDGARTLATIERGEGERATVRGARLAPVPIDRDAAQVASGRGCTEDDAAYTLPPGATVVIIECDGAMRRRAIVVTHRPATDGRAITLTPLAWRGRFVPERRLARAGDMMLLGGGAAMPGVVTWDVLAPTGAAAALAIPANPTDCAAWSLTRGAGRAAPGGCLVDDGTFAIASLPLVPEAGAVVERAGRAAFAIGTPPLVLLLALAVSPRRARRTRGLARALRLGVLGAVATALVCWRLLWAYRIDVMRELVTAGSRVASNELAAIAMGAALAGCAVLALDALDGRSATTRALRAIGAWLAWLVVTVLATGITLSPTRTTVGVLGLSLATTLVPLLGPLAHRHAARLGPEVALGAIVASAILARLAAPRAALIKLALAYALVLAGHAGLRVLLARETPWHRRGWLLATLAGAAGALAGHDAGVALAIAGTGLALAMIVAGHDAAYDASHAGRIGVLEHEHARLILVHAGAAAVVAIGLASAALAADADALREHGALVVLHAPLVIAAVFAMAALIARSHRRGWVPWLAAALVALTVWGVRDDILLRVTAANGVGAQRVAAVVDPGYALLRDERAFAASASAWRETTLIATIDPVAIVERASVADRWRGEGFFGARLRDPGVVQSIDNDYVPILVARELGIVGLLQGTGLLLAIVIGAGALASARLRHASREHRARALICATASVLVLYQPLAALGVLPLTGISWPGLGIDSPADLWIFIIGATWCVQGGTDEADDERVRSSPRLARARRVALVALVIAALATIAIVARAGACALDRVPGEDARIEAAIRYAASIACPWTERSGSAVDDLVPSTIGGTPRDPTTARFDRELQTQWTLARPGLVAALAPDTACAARGERWRVTRAGDACVARVDAGWPAIRLSVQRTASGLHATCAIERTTELLASVRASSPPAARPRIRVVGMALGAAATDLGELVADLRVVRMRATAPVITLVGAPAARDLVIASSVALATDVSLAVRPTPRGVVLRGPAELFVADPDEPTAWRRMIHGGEVVLDRLTLIVAGPVAHRVVALFRPARAWPDAPAVVDPLLADEVGDRTHRVYPYGAALPELGWVNPFDVDRSLGLDGWIHAALARASMPAAPRCGTLAPPPTARDRVCTPSPFDGVTECRVALQPELALRLRTLAEDLLANPEPHTGRDIRPVRAAYVVLRGDTGELLAQGNLVNGRPPLAYAPGDPAAAAVLARLRDEPAESDPERVDWNLPIAVGSTIKPIVARAAEQAFPDLLPELTLTAAGHATGCKARRGRAIAPILGHCPPTSVAGSPTTADLHDFLARSPNWYAAALGLVGLGLPAATLTAGDRTLALADLHTDLASWSTRTPLTIADPGGPILTGRGVVIAGVRRAPLWSRLEALLGRPLCTLGDRAACDRAAARADVCAARALPIDSPGSDLRYLVALGPDRVSLYADDRPAQTTVPVREYLQFLRGSGARSLGSLAQLTDAFGRVVYDPSPGAPRLAASWFPAPAVGVVPAWSCASGGHAAGVLGADGGLCGVLRAGGTAHTAAGALLADPTIIVYGAKTGTIDSLADIARRPASCRAWNAHHLPAAQLECGKVPPDDSLFVIAFGVVTPTGTIPVTLGIQLQRAGKGAATRASRAFVRAIADYLRAT